MYTERKSKFTDHLIQKGHEMRNARRTNNQHHAHTKQL